MSEQREGVPRTQPAEARQIIAAQLGVEPPGPRRVSVRLARVRWWRSGPRWSIDMDMCMLHAVLVTRRLVILIDEREHDRLRRLAARRGQSVGMVAREAIRRSLDAQTLPDRDQAVAFLCEEHDAGFSWSDVKRELERRHGG